MTNGSSEDDYSEDEDEIMEMPEKEAPPPFKFERRRRSGVSSESFNPNQPSQFKLKVVPKGSEAKARIAAAIKNNILFMNLDDEQRKTLFDAMFEVPCEAGKPIITQGADGDNFYVIDSGEFDVYVKKQDVEPFKAITLKQGNSFGELALMYNCPRAATVQATVDGPGVLWAMDRETFRHIILFTTAEKRKRYESFLEKVPILATLNTFERATIADTVVEMSFQDGEAVVTQGDSGSLFYIIVQGGAVAKQGPSADEQVEVKSYSEGDYFGELALLKEEPRAASVFAKGCTKCVALDRASFIRLLGPIEDLLERNAGSYKSYEDVIKSMQEVRVDS